MDDGLSPAEFAGIRQKLESISDTWADLWLMLGLTQASVTQLLRCRHQDVRGKVLVLPAHGRFAERHLSLTPTARVIILHRRQRHPDDEFLFQSHSLRVSATARPVTLIAFNTALKKAARGITHKTVSSKSARLKAPAAWRQQSTGAYQEA